MGGAALLAPARRAPSQSAAAPPRRRETGEPPRAARRQDGAAGRLLALRAPAAPVLRRKCACGGEAGPDGECVECRRRRLQTKRGSEGASPDAAPPVVGRVLGGAGRPLDAGTRAFMEWRFGRSFGDVRVHADGEAAASARAVGALAYTVGRQVVFGAGRYAPQTPAGRRLLAHELAHVVQQGAPAGPDRTGGDGPLRRAIPVAPAADPLEEAADRAADAVVSGADAALGPAPAAAGTLQRSLAVFDPAGAPAGAPAGVTHETIVRDYIHTLCPSFTVTGGNVVPTTPDFCDAGVAGSGFPEGCGCLCELHNAKQRGVLAFFQRLLTGTAPDDRWTIRVDDTDWPHTDEAAREVTVHSPFSGVRFGSWSPGAASHRIDLPNWLVLGHELCGHAVLMVRGTHPTGPPPTHGGRPSHDPTVIIQNRIAAEHGVPASEQRGLFADPHHGESWGRVTVEGFAPNSSTIPATEIPKLDTAAHFITTTGGIMMDVVGHADQTGTPAINATVSQARADAVRANLDARLGITSAMFLSVRGAGSSACATPGLQPSCRKAEVFMFVNEGASETHP